MLNVNVKEFILKKLKEEDYILEHRNNQLTIRGYFGEPLCEIFYIEETNEILVMTEKEAKYGQKVETIEFNTSKGLIVYLSSKQGKKMDKIEVQ